MRVFRFRSGVSKDPAFEQLDDGVGDLAGIVGRINKEVTLGNLPLGKLAVHLPSRPLVVEAVSEASSHTFDASIQGGQQDQVVEADNAARLQKRGEGTTARRCRRTQSGNRQGRIAPLQRRPPVSRSRSGRVPPEAMAGSLP